jgi:CubicO group peptidase (beta-lactamase class C family)
MKWWGHYVGSILLLAIVASSAFGAEFDLARIDSAIAAQVSSGQFMGAVLIARDRRVLLNKGYGQASLEWRIPNSSSTRFRLGSATKQFTAASILLLQQEGQLTIEDPVSKYMPDAPAAWSQITIFNLLTHTSGIHEITALPDFDASEPFPTTPERLVARFRDLPLDFTPGAEFRYSNSGYILLGYLIEKITGEPYREYVQKKLFNPLGMKDSGYDSNVEIIPRHAEGYAPKSNGFTVAGYVDMTIPFAAGGLYSTTADLLRWEEGLYGGKVLQATALTRMKTPFKKDYALGLVVDPDSRGATVIWHCGAIEGFASCVGYVPVEQLAVIVLSNVEGPGAHTLLKDILKIAGHEPLTPK